MLRILGLDPGLTHTGYGLVDADGNARHYVACGRISPHPALPLPERLKILHGALCDLIAHHKPDAAAVEETFVNDNPRGALKLGAARGVALLAPALHTIPVESYAPTLVKKTITGSGHADKAQIAHMVKILLPSAFVDTPNHSLDAVDALAIALTHAQHVGLCAILTGARA